MALKATKDTYGFENVGGVEVRRLVKAGDVVPSTYRIEDSSATEEITGTTGSDALKPTKAQKEAAEAAKSEPTAEDAAVAPAREPAAGEEAGGAADESPQEKGAEAGTSTTKKSGRR
jgi:hypothetical protein